MYKYTHLPPTPDNQMYLPLRRNNHPVFGPSPRDCCKIEKENEI